MVSNRSSMRKALFPIHPRLLVYSGPGQIIKGYDDQTFFWEPPGPWGPAVTLPGRRLLKAACGYKGGGVNNRRSGLSIDRIGCLARCPRMYRALVCICARFYLFCAFAVNTQRYMSIPEQLGPEQSFDTGSRRTNRNQCPVHRDTKT